MGAFELKQAATQSYAAERLNPDFGFYLKNSQLLVSKRSSVPSGRMMPMWNWPPACWRKLQIMVREI